MVGGGAEPDILLQRGKDSGARPHVVPGRTADDGGSVLHDRFGNKPGKYQHHGLQPRAHLGEVFGTRIQAVGDG